MLSLLTRRSSGLLLSLAVSITPCLAQDMDQTDKQLKSDSQELSADQQELSSFKNQAKWYDTFAKQRLTNAAAERQEVEKRLKLLEEANAANPKKDAKSNMSQEIEVLKGWLASEEATRDKIERTRAQWHAAVEAQASKTNEASYQVDVDKAAEAHKNEIAKEKAEIQAENPKPKPPQVQQNTVLMPGWETEQGNLKFLPKQAE
jgi:hypothetical protein